MAKKKAKPRPKLAWLVCVYEVRHEDQMIVPGAVLKVPEKELGTWQPYIERWALTRCPSKKKAEALAKTIEDGTFQLAPDVKHSMAHGGLTKW